MNLNNESLFGVKLQLFRLFPRDPEEKGGVLTLYPSFDSLPHFLWKDKHALIVHDELRNLGILGVLFSKMHPVQKWLHFEISVDVGHTTVSR